MRKGRHLLLLLSLSCLLPDRAAGGLLPAVTETLGNGLRVILHQDRRFPLVMVHLRYHVGARHERPGRTGLAHLFEHLMFRGSRNLAEPFDYLFQVGASAMNGTTTYDHTDYYELMPAANLAIALWMESDRMGFLPEVFEGRRGDLLRDERRIVKNERRMRLETVPYRAAQEKLWQVLFPAPHPYHGMVIGAMADLDAAEMPELKEFFARHYAPSNATLTLVGDFDSGKALALIRRYFGSLPARPRPEPPAVQPVALTRQVTLRHDEEVGAGPRLIIAWHSPAAYQPGDRAAQLLSDILAGHRAARLPRRLGRTARASAEQESLALQSVFRIELAPGRTAREEELLSAADAVLDEIRSRGVTADEVRQARAHMATALLSRLEGLAGKAELLLDYQSYLGEPDSLAQDLAAYDKVTPEEIRRLAQEVLRPDRRVVLYAVPKGGAR